MADDTPLVAEPIQNCPECKGEVTFMYGLGGGTTSDGGIGAYWVCLDCDWQGPRPKETVCFPHGLIDAPKDE